MIKENFVAGTRHWNGLFSLIYKKAKKEPDPYMHESHTVQFPSPMHYLRKRDATCLHQGQGLRLGFEIIHGFEQICILHQTNPECGYSKILSSKFWHFPACLDSICTHFDAQFYKKIIKVYWKLFTIILVIFV